MSVPWGVVVSVGTAVVSGRRADRIGIRVAQWLEKMGVEVHARHVVPDDEERIGTAVAAALGASPHVVVVCGGLGASADDRSREGIARAVGTPLEVDTSAAALLERRYRERGREMPDGALRQACCPAGAQLLPNALGTAPGVLVDRGRTLLFAVPGVQREMEEMLERSVAPLLRQRLLGASSFRSTVLHVAGLPEMEVDRIVAEALGPESGARVTLLPSHGEIDVLVALRAESDDEADEALARVVADVEVPLGDHVYGRDETSLVGVLRDELVRREWTLAVGESLTGGLIAKTIVDLPGATSFFAGSLVPYIDSRKPDVLAIPEADVEQYGAVSAAVARGMAEGARTRLRADVGLAAAGIAGPSGGSQERPIGLTYVALAWPGRTVVRRFVFSGDRKAIRTLATVASLDQARRALLGLPLLGEDAQDPGDAGA